MRRTNLSLDEEIAAVEARLARHRARLGLLASEARSRIAAKSTVPLAVAGALAVGFVASRFLRRRRKPPPAPKPATPTTPLFGAIAAALLPALVRPLQHAVARWLSERIDRHTTR